MASLARAMGNSLSGKSKSLHLFNHFNPVKSISTSKPSSLIADKRNEPNEYDVIIAGGGLVGTALACALSQSSILSNRRILLLEAGNPKIYSASPDRFSNRVSAIGPGSRDFLTNLGVWQRVEKMRVRPVKKMQIWESCSDSFVTYEQPEMKSDVTYIVENDVLTSALFASVYEASERVEVLTNTRVKAYKLPGYPRGGDQIPLAVMELEDGRRLKAKLIVGADGVNSLVRRTMKAQYVTWEYNQQAIVATLRLAEPTVNVVAWQRFLPTGPIALLPLDDEWSSLVWTNTTDKARSLLNLDDDAFVDAVNRAMWSETEKIGVVETASRICNDAMKTVLGKSSFFSIGRSVRQLPPSISFLDPESRASFPLGLGHAVHYVTTRTALVGDSAHRVHPLAGLGVNLGYADIRELLRSIESAAHQGSDIGHLPHLLEYERERQRRVVPTMAAIDALHRMYSTTLTPVVLLRSLGLQLTEACIPLKEKIMEQASR